MQNENVFVSEEQDSEIIKTVITNEFNFLNYFAFLVLNFIIAILPIILMFNWLSIREDSFIIALYAASIAMMVFILQYPLLVFAKPWIAKFVVLYLSMCLFFFIFGLTGSLYKGTDVIGLEKIVKHLKDGVTIILLGHIFGIIFFPIVAFINWLLRKQLFVYKEQI